MEVKCPWSLRDTNVEAAAEKEFREKKVTSFPYNLKAYQHLTYINPRTPTLKKSSLYYDQVIVTTNTFTYLSC